MSLLQTTGRLGPAFWALTILACRSQGELANDIDASPNGSVDTASDGADVLGFEQHIFPMIMQAGCGECHAPDRSISSHWALTTPSETYRLWVGFPGFNHCDPLGQQIGAPQPDQIRVIPGDPEGSLVVKKLTAPWEMCGLFFGHMPPSPRPRLPVEQIDLIRAWITAGAPP